MSEKAKRLLVVDDEPNIREIVRRAAASLDFEVELTANATDFKKAYDTFNPTVIVLDIVLPETDGIEIMKWLIERGAKATIIVASGFNPLYGKMAATLGTDRGLSVSFLDKPFKVAALREALNSAVI
jgi:DNA-binding NtrC family response regulator